MAYYTTEETYTTSAIDLVAAFIACGDRVRVERDPSDDPDSDHVTFLVRGRDLSVIMDEWDKGTLSGNLTNYARAMKRVKSMLHTFQGQRRYNGR